LVSAPLYSLSASSVYYRIGQSFLFDAKQYLTISLFLRIVLGTSQGDVQIWDVVAMNLIRVMSGHEARVGSVTWKNFGEGASVIASGSRDRKIRLRDPRSSKPFDAVLKGHSQEVCGLKVRV
jgi:WD40 repeat protein